MPSNITDVATFTTPVTTVADGDPATGANVAVAIQQLANRTAYLQSNRVRRIETNTALAALTNMLDGEVFLVRGSAGGITESMFIYDANSTLGATYQVFNYVVQPTSIIGANPGRFVNVLAPILNLTDGFGRLKVQGPYGIVSEQTVIDTTVGAQTVNAAFAACGSANVVLNVAIGDAVHVEGIITAAQLTGTSINARLTRISSGVVTTVLTTTILQVTATDDRIFTIMGVDFVSVADAAVTYQIEASSPSGQWSAKRPFQIRTRQIRP